MVFDLALLENRNYFFFLNKLSFYMSSNLPKIVTKSNTALQKVFYKNTSFFDCL